jgi:hypothetical protein
MNWGATQERKPNNVKKRNDDESIVHLPLFCFGGILRLKGEKISKMRAASVVYVLPNLRNGKHSVFVQNQPGSLPILAEH